MNAVRIHEYGDSGVLRYEEAPRPEPGDEEVVIRVKATSVNPFDLAVRAGYLVGYFEHELPLILGTDISGVVADVGPGVSGFSEGDEVYARGGVYRDGSYAEFAAVAAGDVAYKPDRLSFTEAAAIPHAALTAWQALFALGELEQDQTVLIHGAGGGVGHMAVQLAAWKGARVVGTAAENIDFLRTLPVDQAIDYSQERFEEVAPMADIVLDTIGGDTQDRSWSLVKPGGMLVSTIQPPSEEAATEHGVRPGFVTSAPPISETLSRLADMVEAGHLAPEVSFVIPLSEVRRGHDEVAKRHTRGKVAVEVA